MKPLVILTGPTAVGKTNLSIGLAKRINGEIISADSMQVYRKMDIGTAKIMPEEMDGVPHHLIDVLDPKEPFNVVLFKELATKAMDDIYARGRIPVIVGGTGFYIQAVLYDIHFDENDDDKSYRTYLEQLAEKSELSSNYIGMVERGLKEPGLATIVKLLNALNISADTLLCDLVPSASHVTDDEISKRLEGLTPMQKKAALDLLDTYIGNLPYLTNEE